MSIAMVGVTIWLLATGLLMVAIPLVGVRRLKRIRAAQAREETILEQSPVDVLVPIKGVVWGQWRAVTALLEQSHRDYRVLFILEEEDLHRPIGRRIDRLCTQYTHARKVVSPSCEGCAQKNQNLIAGLAAVRAEADILVFCDSTNVADSDWLFRFTRPLEHAHDQVVTTFRVFEPSPATIGGSSQAIYATFVLMLMAVVPRPWGGATGIRTSLFRRLDIEDAWSRTVVDDLVLGNVLDEAGIPIRVQVDCLLRSPLRNQTVRGFLSYLDRQILFPKFTNPGIWAGSLAIHLNLTFALLVSLSMLLVLVPAGIISGMGAVIALVLVGCVALSLCLMRRFPPPAISLARWLAAALPCILLAAFVFLRSVVRGSVIWHGRRYRTGRGGVVVATVNEKGGYAADCDTTSNS